MKLAAKRIAAWVVWTITALLVIGILVGLLLWGVVSTQDASQRRDTQIATLIQTVQGDSTSAASDRATAAANQKALEDYTAALATRQDALLAYLRSHGIHLPTRLVTTIAKPRIIVKHTSPTGKHGRTKVSGSSHHPSVAPSGPGKSHHHQHHKHHHKAVHRPLIAALLLWVHDRLASLKRA